MVKDSLRSQPSLSSGMKHTSTVPDVRWPLMIIGIAVQVLACLFLFSSSLPPPNEERNVRTEIKTACGQDT